MQSQEQYPKTGSSNKPLHRDRRLLIDVTGEAISHVAAEVQQLLQAFFASTATFLPNQFEE
jgi:hypothetical protein